MQITIPKKDILRLVERCQGVADKKSTMPVLANLLLTAAAPSAALGTGRLAVASTDLYMGITSDVEAEVALPGSVALPAKDLFERLKQMPEGPVQILVNDGAQTTLKAAGSPRRYTLHGLPGSEFPQMPKPAADAPTLELPIAVWKKLVARTHFSISTDETRPHVNSALFEWAGDRVRMVSIDGHRLSKMEAAVESTRTGTLTMLIPLKAVTELRKLSDAVLAEGGKSKDKEAAGPLMRLTQTGPNAFFSLGGFVFSVKLVDAQFPPYQQVIPSRVDHEGQLARMPLMASLSAVQLAASDRTGGVKLTFTTNALRITSESPESGSGYDEVQMDYAGPEATIGFNAKYLLDVLSALDDDTVDFGISGELDPAIMRPHDQKDYTAVLMPMRI